MSVSATPSDVRFVAVSLDCADPAELAEFYLQMLGGRLLWSRQGQCPVRWCAFEEGFSMSSRCRGWRRRVQYGGSG
jgi:hypothetical protein